MKSIVYSLLSVLGTLVLWQTAVVLGNVNEALFPSPLSVAGAFAEILADGTLAMGVATSLVRFAVGYLAAIVAGIAGGLLLGSSRLAFSLAFPLVQMVRPIAPVAWMPFVVLLVGIGDAPAIVIIFLAAFFPILVTTTRAVRHVPPVYLKVAANYGMSPLATLFRITLPAVFPQIAGSLHIALGTAWIFLVSGEMVGAQSGLGYMIIDARNNLRVDILLAVMVVIGLIGLLLDTLIGGFERRVMELWGQHETKK